MKTSEGAAVRNPLIDQGEEGIHDEPKIWLGICFRLWSVGAMRANTAYFFLPESWR
jgi:hypothetical protein